MLRKKRESRPGKARTLVIDVGGTHIKVLATGHHEPRQIPSGPDMTPDKMVRDVKRITEDWKYGYVTIGYPGPVIHGRPLREPHNLGGGWVGRVGSHFRGSSVTERDISLCGPGRRLQCSQQRAKSHDEQIPN